MHLLKDDWLMQKNIVSVHLSTSCYPCRTGTIFKATLSTTTAPHGSATPRQLNTFFSASSLTIKPYGMTCMILFTSSLCNNKSSTVLQCYCIQIIWREAVPISSVKWYSHSCYAVNSEPAITTWMESIILWVLHYQPLGQQYWTLYRQPPMGSHSICKFLRSYGKLSLPNGAFKISTYIHQALLRMTRLRCTISSTKSFMKHTQTPYCRT